MPNTTHRLKIGLVLDDSLDKSDGVQQYVLTIGEWLASQGHDVHYLVGATKRQDISGIHSLSRNIAVRFNGNRMSMPLPSSRSKLRQLLNIENFDVLHVQLPYSPYLAHRLIMAANTNTAVIGTFHIVGQSTLVKTATTVLGGWTKRSLRRFDDIVSVSEAASAFALSTFGISTDILPNVVDYNRFRKSSPLAQYSNRLTILFLGRLVPRKGCLILLKAIAKIIQDSALPEFHVIICGKGPLEPKLKAYVAQHNLTDIVDFIGYVTEDEKPHYYASSDIAVFPSTGGESFGIVLLEAMASGHTAVLAGDNVGYRSVLAPRPDLLFDPKDISVLADMLRHFITDASARANAQKWGTQYAAEFDTSVVGPKLFSIYRKALRKRHEQ